MLSGWIKDQLLRLAKDPLNWAALAVTVAVVGLVVWLAREASTPSRTVRAVPPSIQCQRVAVPTATNPLQYVGTYCFDLPEGEAFWVMPRTYFEVVSEGQRTQFEFVTGAMNVIEGMTQVAHKYPAINDCFLKTGGWAGIKGKVLEPASPGDRYTRIMVRIGYEGGRLHPCS